MKKILLKLMEFYTYKHLLFKSRKTHTLKSTRNVESTIKTRKWDSPETEKCWCEFPNIINDQGNKKQWIRWYLSSYEKKVQYFEKKITFAPAL